MAKTKEQKRREAEARQRSSTGKSKHILVVDDVRWFAYATHHVTSSAGAIQYIRNNPRIDVLMLDYHLHGETTDNLVDWLLGKIEDRAKPRIGLVVLLTGSDKAASSMTARLSPHYKVLSESVYQLVRKGIATV